MATASEARHKGIVWCEHSINAKFCVVCSVEGVKPLKSKKVKKVKAAPPPLSDKPGPIPVG